MDSENSWAKSMVAEFHWLGWVMVLGWVVASHSRKSGLGQYDLL